MKTLSLCKDYIRQNDFLVFFDFYDGGNLAAGAPRCAMTLRRAGSMRFRWNEENPARKAFFEGLTGEGGALSGKNFVPVELNHTHIVYDVSDVDDTLGKVGDGIIIRNAGLVPVITVADCVPVFLYEPKSGVFGIVHSGWKGTGIACDAISLACRNYGCRAEDFLVVIGPHINECCYIVDEERAEFFAQKFSPDCVSALGGKERVKISWNNGGGRLYRLSLTDANVAALKKIGVQDEKITVYTDCTCCTSFTPPASEGAAAENPAAYPFGSNRRETALAGTPHAFTVMAAFIFK